MTALRHVAWTGKNQIAAAKRLIAAKADVNLVADDDWTPLMRAAQRDQVDVVVVLLAYCARTDVVDSFFKWNALKFAKSDAVKSAIQAGAGPNCPK